MESDLRTLLLTYMFAKLPGETNVPINKIAFGHENNQWNKRSKQGDACMNKIEKEGKNPSIFVALSNL